MKIDKYFHMYGIKDEILFEEVEKPEQHWILCSERLPENSTEVLVTRRFLGSKDGSHVWNKHIPPKDYVEIATRNGEDWTAYSDEYKVARNRHTDPIAWMPLPEPYKGET